MVRALPGPLFTRLPRRGVFSETHIQPAATRYADRVRVGGPFLSLQGWLLETETHSRQPDSPRVPIRPTPLPRLRTPHRRGSRLARVRHPAPIYPSTPLPTPRSCPKGSLRPPTRSSSLASLGAGPSGAPCRTPRP